MAQEENTPVSRKKASKQFYQRFQREYHSFYQTIQGIPLENERQTYAMLLLKRLMVLYFLQYKGLLDYDKNYLSNRLRLLQKERGRDYFYHYYLIPLFHKSLHQSIPMTDTPFVGHVPSLALPLFQVHPIEDNVSHIQITDAAFTQIFAFFDQYQWKVAGRTQDSTADELYPEILGDIFEQQINQKQMGAYYTKDDVTTYIATHTILPYLLRTVATQMPEEFARGSILWKLLQDRPERYISQALQSKQRLEKETKRECGERQARYQQLLAQLRAGEIHTIDDLITCNLDIAHFVQDGIAHCTKPELLLAFYKGMEQMSILDPTCGSGAFLVAAVNTLAPLYTDCLKRLQSITDNDTHLSFSSTSQHACFNREERDSYYAILKKVEEYPTRRHFVLRTILSNNLYGVDIMEEATDLCKLRMFLTLAACSERIEDVPTFSSVKWHIVTGNTLIGSVRNRDPNRIQMQDRASFHWFEEFPEVMERGGFDVIIGNPPYVEYSKVRHEYQAAGSEAAVVYGNLYAAVLERSLALCRPGKSYLGLIVPLSLCGGERFGSLRRSITRQTAELWLSNFEIFPSRLFDGAFQRLSILLARHENSAKCTTYSTRIQRWYAVERPYLIDLLQYTHAQRTVKADVFPKLASPLQETILQKLVAKAQGNSIASMLYPYKTKHFVYYQEATNYWMKATCIVPYYKKNGVIMEPSHGRFLYFSEQRVARTIMALLNSSLFYLWFATFSDGFHLTHRLVKEFPLLEALYANEDLEQLALRLEEGIKLHARMSTRNTKAHAIELEEYHMSASKELLDKIDGVLARYYGLSTEELTFVVHYDGKYRMGREE
ncbi:MAG TPA: DNA methyltransferase [Ktedonobacteraceae bacterium]